MSKITLRDGAKLNVHMVGRGPTVVLLHGFAMPAFLWLPFIAPLAHKYRFVLPDLRGFGGSHRLALSTPCLLDQHASDLADVLGYLGESQVLLGGLSMGACTALQYQRHHSFGAVRAYLHMDQAVCVRNGPDWEDGLLGPEQAARLGAWSALMQDMEPYRGQAFNTMAQSVRERTSELGVLKAIGFTNLRVLSLVMMESCLIAILGGFGGLGVAWLIISAGNPRFPHLSSTDRYIRAAARTALEHQPIAEWEAKALAETNVTAQLEALLALTRVTGVCPTHRAADHVVNNAMRDKLWTALLKHDFTKLTPEQRLAHYAYADSAEHREGLAAFLEKRPAQFKGE